MDSFCQEEDNITVNTSSDSGDSFLEYLQNLDSFLKFDSPDKWLFTDLQNQNVDDKCSNEGEIEKENLAEDCLDDQSEAERYLSDSSLDEHEENSLTVILHDEIFQPFKDGSMHFDIEHKKEVSRKSIGQLQDNGSENHLKIEEDTIASGKTSKVNCDNFISELKNARRSYFKSTENFILFDSESILESNLSTEAVSSCCDRNSIQKKLSSKEEKCKSKRCKVIQELFATEETYHQHLELIVQLFEEPLHELQILNDQTLATIFANIKQIMAVNHELAQRLTTMPIGEAFLQLAPFLKLYSSYANNHEKALATLMEWDLKCPEFSAFRRQREDLPEMKGLKLNALLITPVQRIPRYKLLLEELLSCTAKDDGDYKAIEEAVSQIKSVASHINEHIRQQDNFMRMLVIQKSLSCSVGPRILIPGRIFIKEGPLRKVSRCGSRSYERMFFLFSDILMYAKPRFLESSGRYNSLVCCCILPLHHCKVEQVLGHSQGQGSLFTILCKNESLLLYSDQKTVGGWMDALKKAIDEVQLNRQTLRKMSSAKQPLRRIGIERLWRKERMLDPLSTNSPDKSKSRNRVTGNSSSEGRACRTSRPVSSKHDSKIKDDEGVNSEEKILTPKKNFGIGLACLKKRRRKFAADSISSNGPYKPIQVAASGRDKKKTENQYINKETENQCGVRNDAVNQPAMKSTSSKSLHSSRSCASINQPLATKQSVSSTTNEKSKKLTRSQTFRENPTSSTCSIAKRNVSLRQKLLS